MSSKRLKHGDLSVLLSCVLALTNPAALAVVLPRVGPTRGGLDAAHGHQILSSASSAVADSQCNTTTTALQAAIDAAAAGGGGVARISCGFHATGPLSLHGGVTVSAAECVVEAGDDAPPGQLILGACTAEQMHIIHLTGDNVTVRNVHFDCSNLTIDTNRDMAAVHSMAATQGVVLEGNRFANINMSSQGFHAVILSGCDGCTVRGNVVEQSGGDALNFNAGEYIITGNVVENTGDGCIALNNNAFGVVAHNILRRCNLGIGAGPAGSVASSNASTPFVITSNLIEDSDYGVLLGWFAYAGRLGPVNCIVSHNIVRRCRSTAIQNNGAPGMLDGAWIVSENQITHTGFPATQPPRTQGPGPGHGIVAVQLHDVAIRGNIISHGRGIAITAETALHYVISDNIISADPDLPYGSTSTGIAVAAADDISVAHNTVRGFGQAITVSDISDRVRITANNVDLSGNDSVGIHAGLAVARIVVSGNTVSGAGKSTNCVTIAGSPSSSRVSHDNVCW